ncbi:hypothetical protein [Niveispirillum sp. KHB5.9]|uniref:hypothetical protein n=1 Tax=Niveispirillum sp. KHB5.9 TaxID=3400269 RepID=UPI003A89BDAF
MSVPADSRAPAGTPAMVMCRLSDPSRSVSADWMFSGMPWPDTPTAAATCRLGVSATGRTLTCTWALTELLMPATLVTLAVTLRSKSTSLLAGGVSFRPVSWAAVRVQLPLPLLVPADRVAPVGTPATVTDRTPPTPRASVAMRRSSGTAISSRVVTSRAARWMAAAAGCTCNVTEELAWAMEPVLASSARAVTDRFRLPVATPSGSFRVRPDSCAAVTD